MVEPPSSGDVAPQGRGDRRRRTESDILDAARELFAEAGFERTTIRGVAARAGIDPALVMQYYGNKEGLFSAAARWHLEAQSIHEASLDRLPGAALQDLFSHFEDTPDRGSAAALLRNCLTHPAAAQLMRDDVMCDRAAAVAAKIDGPDAELRAALFGSVIMGLGMARYLMELEPLASASRDEVERLLGPALSALLEGPAEGPPARP